MLIANYILRERRNNNTLPQNGALVKTIVTTNMADVIADKYKVALIEVLTGFKYIGEQIKEFDKNNSYSYVFGLEESYGCLAGSYARDKDACVAVMLLCEVAAYCKCNHITLWDEMMNMYKEYGYYREGLETMTLKGIEGANQIKEMMEKLRNNPPANLGGLKVEKLRDYEKGIAMDIASKEEEKLSLPKSNVLYFQLENDSWCAVRPSGTEPKIKFYIGTKEDSIAKSDAKIKDIASELVGLAK